MLKEMLGITIFTLMCFGIALALVLLVSNTYKELKETYLSRLGANGRKSALIATISRAAFKCALASIGVGLYQAMVQSTRTSQMVIASILLGAIYAVVAGLAIYQSVGENETETAKEQA